MIGTYKLVVAGGIVFAISMGQIGSAVAQEDASAVTEKKRAIATCLALIRGCQLGDGAFRMKADGNAVWINPYFANHAALAILVGHCAGVAAPSDLKSVERWLLWYARNQRKDGTINDFEGSVSGYKDASKCDSVDSYAATFLLVVERHHRITKNTPPQVQQAAKLALQAIHAVSDRDGLTIAKPEYRIKYLMDNIEAYGGLVAASRYFRSVNEKADAAVAESIATAIGVQLPAYWRVNEAVFASSKDENGRYQAGWKLYPDGLANLFAMAWISDEYKQPWTRMQRDFVPDGGEAPQAPVERWLIAASRVGSSNEIKQWRAKTVKEASTFTKGNVYIHRPAVCILALVEGAEWLPRIESARRASRRD